MQEKNNWYDIIAVGAGSGGLNIASFMNKAGFKVLLIDKTDKSIGGDCLNFGCVPSKSLIHVSKMVHQAKNSEKFGLKVSGKVDMKRVRDYVSSKKEHIRKHESADYFRSQGLDVALGIAKFTGKNSVEVNGKEYFAKKIILATSSKARIPKIRGIEDVDFLTNESIFDLTKLPKKLLIIGAGPIGTELGQAFARLGSNVSLIQRGDQFLKKEHSDVSKILHEQLLKEGIKVLLKTKPLEFTSKNTLSVRSALGEEKELKFDKVLIATGRSLNIPEGLDKAGVNLENKGCIVVDDRLRTSNKNIFLCGDIVGGPQFTHAAELHAGIILNNFFSPFKKKITYEKFSWVTFTDPEIATFGLSESELIEKNIYFQRVEHEYQKTDRGVTDNKSGKIILFIGKNKILGGTIIAPNAGEIAQELTLAMHAGISVKKIFSKIYAYPTASRINKTAITKIFEGKLNSRTKSILGFLFKVF